MLGDKANRKFVMNGFQLCEENKIIVLHAIQFIETLLPDHLKLTSEYQKMSILMNIRIIPSSKMVRILCSIASLKVVTSKLLFKVAENQFDLYMKVDTNTNGHRQWFYFSVRNNKKAKIKLNIFRFKKRYSLFQRGMKPYIRSFKSGSEWEAGGFNIYYKYEKINNIDTIKKQSKTYYLTFQYKFEHSDDQVYFCSGIPYTYTFLQKRINQFQEISSLSEYFAGKKLKLTIQRQAKSLCGLEMPSITIQPATDRQKKYLIINARTHSGQASSSWVMDGFIEKVITSKEIQQWMIENQISFKILPMLNPDGVYLGNYRTGIIGDDFNRKFATGKKQIFPEIHYLKLIIAKCKKNGQILLFLDLHGHSILRNSFIYGPVQSLFTSNPLRNLPTTLWHSTKYFQLSSCKFSFQKNLIETARVYFQLKESILTYTSETSLGLYKRGTAITQMLQHDYQSLGGSIVESMASLLTKIKCSMPMINTETRHQFAYGAHKNSKNQHRNIEKRKTTNFFNISDQQLLEREIRKNPYQLDQKKKSQSHYQNRNIKIKKLENLTISGQRQENEKLQKKLSISGMKSQNIRQISKKISRSICARNSIIKSKDSSIKLPQKSIKMRSEVQKIQTIQKTVQTEEKQKYSETQGKQSKEIDKVKANLERRSKQSRDSNNHQNKFKIRKKSDLIKILPQSYRKKIGSRGFMHLRSTNYIQDDQQQQQYTIQRSVTYDSAFLSSQLRELNESQQIRSRIDNPKIEDDSQNLQIIDEQKFSEQYNSINDSDSSSDDLEKKKKQYLLQYIRNNPRLKTNIQQTDLNIDEETNLQATNSFTNNINKFKQIQFKSLEPGNKNQSGTPINRLSKRDPTKFRETAHKSLSRNFQNGEETLMVHMVQKKQLNERVYRRTQRDPYFLVQIKNKLS